MVSQPRRPATGSQGPARLTVAGAEAIDGLEPLFAELHAHHAAVAPALAGLEAVDGAEAWRRRRTRYAQWLATGGFVVLAHAGDVLGHAGGELAHAGDVLAGCAVVALAEGYDGWGAAAAIGEVKDLVVAASARRAGLASALLDAVRAELAARGIPTFRLDVLEANAEALAFYRSYGLAPLTVTLGAAVDPAGPVRRGS